MSRAIRKLTVFCRLFAFGTETAELPISALDQPGAGSGSKTMTYNFSGLQQFAMSVVGALIASSLFISAAVGPVGQFI